MLQVMKEPVFFGSDEGHRTNILRDAVVASVRGASIDIREKP